MMRWADTTTCHSVCLDISQITVCKGICFIEINTPVKHPSLPISYPECCQSKLPIQIALPLRTFASEVIIIRCFASSRIRL